ELTMLDRSCGPRRMIAWNIRPRSSVVEQDQVIDSARTSATGGEADSGDEVSVVFVWVAISRLSVCSLQTVRSTFGYINHQDTRSVPPVTSTLGARRKIGT